MGIYNTYNGVQLKVARELKLKEFNIGDKVDIADGIYVGHDGFVIVYQGKLLATHPHITSTWGDTILPEEILKTHHWAIPLIEKAKKCG